MPIEVDPGEVHTMEVDPGEVSQVEQPSAAARFFGPLNPMPIVYALFKPSGDKAADLSGLTLGRNVVDLVTNLGMAQIGEGQKAIEALKNGKHLEATARGLAALTPILGPMSQQAADKYIKGDYAGGNGIMFSMIAPEVVPEAMGALKNAASATGDALKSGTAIARAVATHPKVIQAAAKVIPRGKELMNLHEVVQDVRNELKGGAKGTPGPATPSATVQPPPPAPAPATPVAAATTPVAPPPAWDVEVRGGIPPLNPGGKTGNPATQVVENAPGSLPSIPPPEVPITPAALPEVSSPAGLAVPAEAAATPAPAAVVDPKLAAAQALKDAMAESGSLPEVRPEMGPGSAAYEAEARHMKTQVIADALDKADVPADALEKLPHDSPLWKQLFNDLGQHEPGKSSGNPKATIDQTIVKLKAIQRAKRVAEEAKRPAPRPAVRATASTEPTGMNAQATALAQQLKDMLDEDSNLGQAMTRKRK